MNDTTAVPRLCVVCGGDLKPPAGYNGIYSTVLGNNGEQHYQCWTGPTPAAVLRERERCAKIAENPGFIQAQDTEWDEGVNYAKRFIANAIRNGEVGPTTEETK